MAEVTIRVTGFDGSDTVTIIGDSAGEDGIWLETDVEGFMDLESESFTRAISGRAGQQRLGHRLKARVLNFRVAIEHGEGKGNSWHERDNRWRKLWDRDKQSTIQVTSRDGTRELKVVLEEIKVDTRFDPHTNEVTSVTMSVVADDPFWYDHSNKVEMLIGLSQDVDISVPAANPTDRVLFPKFVLEGSGRWTIPDFGLDFHHPSYIQLPHMDNTNEMFTVDQDPAARQVVSNINPNVWRLMRGRRFRGGIPRRVGDMKMRVRVDVNDVSVGSRRILILLPRAYERPWGDV